MPDEAAALVRALLTADKNQHFPDPDGRREARNDPEIDFRPFIIADADTGHGGDAHVRNLIRRFVEVGVPGYHIEDQKPGAKKCGHQGGKVLVGQDEQNRRLNAARLQLDIMRVPGIIVARTDAEAATFLDNRTDERDQPFILGATNPELPSYRVGFLAILRSLHDLGLDEIRGHLLFAVPDHELQQATAWLARVGLRSLIERNAALARERAPESPWTCCSTRSTRGIPRCGRKRQASRPTARLLGMSSSSGSQRASDPPMTLAEWRAFASRASFSEVADMAASLDIQVAWDPELPKTPEGFYQVQGGIDYAIAKSLAAAPFADLLWMETKTRTSTTPGSSRRRSTPSTPTRCWRTTCRPRSTGTPPG